jgi:hypothetical protein
MSSLTHRPVSRRASFHPGSTSFRKALVFEREITLDADGEQKRWSLQVPATTMNPEMVDMMIELQDLNSFFKGGLETLDHSVSVLDKEKSRLAQPTLMLSTSNFTIPISLESSPSLASDVPLAVRRGMQVPPPLTVKPVASQDLYPGIPSAFLSPSDYSPNVEHTSYTDDLSMDLEAMVANLRSRCAPFQEFSTPVSGSFKNGLEDIPHAQYPMVPSDADYEEDEWAFSNGWVEPYVQEVLTDRPTKSTVNALAALFDQDIFSAATKPVPATSADSDSDVFPTTPDLIRTDNTFNYAPVSKGSVEKPGSVSSEQKRVTHSTISRPPSSPLPPRPAIVNSSTPKRVRGILKSCKSVRFASLPSAGEVPAKALEIVSPKTLSGPSVASSPDATGKSTRKTLSSPPRAIPLRSRPIPAANGATRPKAIPTSLSPPRIPKKTVFHPPANKTTTMPASTVRPSSTPASTKAERRKTMVTPLPPWNSRPAVVSPKKTTHFAVPSAGSPARIKKPSQPLTPYVGRRSLGGPAVVNAGKENRPRASSSPAAPSRWSVLINENSARRSLRDSGAQKSRMPVPLRNILTRFK